MRMPRNEPSPEIVDYCHALFQAVEFSAGWVRGQRTMTLCGLSPVIGKTQEPETASDRGVGTTKPAD